MNSDSWDDRRRAQEEAFFAQQNNEALARIQARKSEEKPRLSPITGKPMTQRTVMGVVVDQCDDSKGIWLDAGELEQIAEAMSAHTKGDDTNKKPSDWFSGFSSLLRGGR